jgi:hypothetical protein
MFLCMAGQHPFLVGVDPKLHARALKALVRRCKTAAAERDAEQARMLDELGSSEIMHGRTGSGSESGGEVPPPLSGHDKAVRCVCLSHEGKKVWAC